MSGALDQLQADIAAVAERVGPSVVGLGRGWGRGSGVVFAPGRVLTNAHVLRGDSVAVRRHDGTVVPGRVQGTEADLDLAVISVDTGEAPAVSWEPGSPPATGAAVFALADPGGRGLRVTLGFVSIAGQEVRGPRGRRIAGMIEHTAPLPRGASGGPLVDAGGRLLGINTVRLEGGLILALPADAGLKARAEALARGEASPRPRLGVALARPRGESGGLLVRAVQEGSPAHAAGIRGGDRLVRAGGRDVGSLDDLLDALEASSGSLEVGLERGAQRITVDVAL